MKLGFWKLKVTTVTENARNGPYGVLNHSDQPTQIGNFCYQDSSYYHWGYHLEEITSTRWILHRFLQVSCMFGFRSTCITNGRQKIVDNFLRVMICFLLQRPNLFAICNNTFSKWWEGWRMSCRRVLGSTPLLVRGSETGGDSGEYKLTNKKYS
jgi:hypothetical protein